MDQTTIEDFLADVASDKPTPGGGSVSALAGSMGASLARMVAGLTLGKDKYAEVEMEMQEVADLAEDLQEELTKAVARDSDAFDAVMAAFRLPRETDGDKEARSTAIQAATRLATEVPLQTAKAAAKVIDLAQTVAEKGNPNAITDAGVAALLGLAAVEGALLNVDINLGSIKDEEYKSNIELAAETLRQQARAAKESTMALVAGKL